MAIKPAPSSSETHSYENIPIVMLSSKDGVFDKARGRMVGAQQYLTKPFVKDALLQSVQHFAGTKKRNKTVSKQL